MVSRNGVVFLSITRLRGGAEKYLEGLYHDFRSANPGVPAEFREILLRSRFPGFPLRALLGLPKGTVIYNMSVLGVYFAPLLFLKLVGRRVILYPHIVTDHRTLNSKAAALRNLLGSLCLKLADEVILISDGNARTLENRGCAGKSRIVYNYVNCESGAPPAFVPDRNLAIIGRFQNRHKRQLQFLQRFGAPCRSLGIHVHLFGDGEDRESIAALVAAQGLEGSVTLHGWVSEEEIFARPFAFVLSYSEWEGLPLNVLESIYRDKVVLAREIPGVAELIHPAFRFRDDEGLLRLLRAVVAEGRVDLEALAEQKAKVFAKYSKRRAMAGLRAALLETA